MECIKEILKESDELNKAKNQNMNPDAPEILKKPLVLTKQQYQGILKHITKDEEIKEQNEEERKYREYLKEGSRQLMKSWPNAIEKSSEFKPLEIDRKTQQYMERLKESERIYEELKERDAKVREENIAKAQHMIQRLKPGPRELESAAMLCEVLKGREIQMTINSEFNKKLQEYKKKEEMKMQSQAVPWIEDEQKRMIENRKRSDDFKNELIKMMKCEERRKIEYAKRQTEIERKMREHADEELKAQIERERAYLMRKKELQRKNALEAMKMVEQRRMRDKFENEIDDQINAVVSSGKRCINKIRAEKERLAKEEKIRQQENNAKKLFTKYTDNAIIEEQRMQKAIDENNAKLDQQERVRIQKDKMMKAARIKYYMEEMERQKLQKAQQCEQFRWDMANRLKNEEINADYEKLKAQGKIKKAVEIRTALLEQMQEKKINQKKQKEMDQKCSDPTNKEQDDEFFMQYANTLITDAEKKNRPILPLLKVVQKYKKDNVIDVIRQEPKHLKSNVPINIQPITSMSGGQPIIKYDLNELKQLNPRFTSRSSRWAIKI